MFLKNVDQQSLDYCCLIYDANKLDTLASAPGMFNRHLQKLPWLGLLTNLVFAQYLFRPLRFDFVLNKQWRHSDCTTYIQDLVIHMSSSTSTQSLLQFLFKNVKSTSAAWSGAPRTPLCLSPSRANWHCPQRPGCTHSSCCSASFLNTVFQSSLFTWYRAQHWLLQQRRREDVTGSLQVLNSSTGALQAAGDADAQTSCGAVFPPCAFAVSGFLIPQDYNKEKTKEQALRSSWCWGSAHALCT